MYFQVIRYNRLLNVIHSSLKDLKKALKGLVVMSQALETMFNSLYNNTVPEMWAAKVWMRTIAQQEKDTMNGCAQSMIVLVSNNGRFTKSYHFLYDRAW